MGKRKAIPKKRRFEVFKRDKFTCQYCGRMAPDVVLEIDHIKPVAEGGNNGMLNLITSCRECNRGKGKTRLSDHQELKAQQKELIDLAEKRDQLGMLMEWRLELADLETEECDAIEEYFEKLTGSYFTESGKAKVRAWIKDFTITEILDAIDISVHQYRHRSPDFMFGKVGGICYNRRMWRETKDGEV